MSYANLVPASDLASDAGWTAVGGGTFFSKIDEAVDGVTHDGTSSVITGSSVAEIRRRFSVTPMVDVLSIQAVIVRFVVDNNGGGAGHEARGGVLINGVDFMDPTWRSASVGSFVTYDYVLAANPATGAPWTKLDIDRIGLVLAMRDPSPGPDTARFTMGVVIVQYIPVPSGTPDARGKASHLIRERRYPREQPQIEAPLQYLDLELGDNLAIDHPAAPAVPDTENVLEPNHPANYGWRNGEHVSRLIRRVIKPMSKTIVLHTETKNGFLCTYWNTLESRVTSSPMEQGTAILGFGGVETFTRNSNAWVEDPLSGLVVPMGVNQKPIARQGIAIENFKKNYLKRSSFVSGGTGFGASSGSSTVVFETSPPSPLFDVSVSNACMRMTAGNPHSVTGVQPWPASDTLSAGDTYCLSIDHMDDPGATYRWRLQRAVDSRYWNDTTLTWDVAVVDNAFTAATTRTRDRSKAIPIGGSSTTVTLSVTQLAGGTVLRVNRTYHVQLEDLEYPTTRIVTDAATYSREVESYLVPNGLSNGVWNNPGGSGKILARPFWSAADMAAAGFPVVWEVYEDSDNWWKLFYNGPAARLDFSFTTGGVQYTASKSWSPVAGTEYLLGWRWLYDVAKHGLAADTMSVFVDTVKGTDVVRAGKAPLGANLQIGGDAGGGNWNGNLRQLLLTQEVYDDEQMAAMVF